jgi:alkylation response protein AidB-like acyl-CoA dehydrogenase
MPLYLNDEQQMLRDAARDFVADAAPVSHMRALRDADDPTGFSRDLWKQFADMGFTGILIGEDQGGLGLGHVEAGVVLEEIGRNLSPSPFLSTAVAAVEALKGTGAAERWFPGIVAGETVAALAIDESAKHRDSVALKAERSGNGFKLSGEKRFVTFGHVADVLLVAARTSGVRTTPTGSPCSPFPRTQASLRRRNDWRTPASPRASPSTTSRSMPTRWWARSMPAAIRSIACSAPAALAPRPSCSASAAVPWT